MKTKYNIERTATSTHAIQTFQVEAKSKEEAIKLFKSDKSEIVDTEFEVMDLEDWDQIDFNDMYEEEK